MGSDVDDAAARGRAQVWQGGADHPDMGRDEDVEGTLPHRFVAVGVDRTAGADARVVDQDVDAAEMPGDFWNDALDRFGIRHVQGPSPNRIAGIGDFPDHGIERFGAHVERRHAGTLVGEQRCRGPAHAACRAGHDGDLALDGSTEFGESHPAIIADGIPARGP